MADYVYCHRCGRACFALFEDGACAKCRAKPIPAFGSTLKQPEGLNPPPLELRSPEPKQGTLI